MRDKSGQASHSLQVMVPHFWKNFGKGRKDSLLQSFVTGSFLERGGKLSTNPQIPLYAWGTDKISMEELYPGLVSNRRWVGYQKVFSCPPRSAIFTRSGLKLSSVCYHASFHQGVPTKQPAFCCMGILYSSGVYKIYTWSWVLFCSIHLWKQILRPVK